MAGITVEMAMLLSGVEKYHFYVNGSAWEHAAQRCWKRVIVKG
jgi:hypothetical protein